MSREIKDWEKEFDKLRISYVMVADEDDETYIHSEGTRIIKDFIRSLLASERAKIPEEMDLLKREYLRGFISV